MSRRDSRKGKTDSTVIAKSKSFQLSDQMIRAALEPFGVAATAEMAEQIRRYIQLLLFWNRKINLTAITKPQEILVRHFGESLYASTEITHPSGRLIDVGTGPGFPGLALKIGLPGLHVKLIEPNLKKCAFLAEVCREVGFSHVEILTSRFEELEPEAHSADYVCSRAVGNLERVLEWAKQALQQDGRLLLWVGEQDALGLRQITGWDWQEPHSLPGSRRRFLLVGAPRGSQ